MGPPFLLIRGGPLTGNLFALSVAAGPSAAIAPGKSLHGATSGLQKEGGPPGPEGRRPPSSPRARLKTPGRIGINYIRIGHGACGFPCTCASDS